MKVIVIKYGGSLLDDANRESLFLEQLAREWKLHRHRLVLVHGGGKEITRQMAKSGIEAKFVGGRRFTDEKTMDFVEKALQSLNAGIVQKLRAYGAASDGYSGRYRHLLIAESIPELGRVGQPTASGVKLDVLAGLTNANLLPVFYPVGEDASGQPLNINADDFAQALAIALHANELIFLTDTGGVLDKAGQLVPQINPGGADLLVKNGTITGGMEVKIQACLAAIRQGVGKVHIGKSIFSDAQGLHVEDGTAIVKEGPTVQIL